MYENPFHFNPLEKVIAGLNATSMMMPSLYKVLLLVLLLALGACGFVFPPKGGCFTMRHGLIEMSSSYLEELANANEGEAKCLVGLTTDSLNIGTRKYKSFLADQHGQSTLQSQCGGCGGADVGVFAWASL